MFFSSAEPLIPLFFALFSFPRCLGLTLSFISVLAFLTARLQRETSLSDNYYAFDYEEACSEGANCEPMHYALAGSLLSDCLTRVIEVP
jgi:hypothetical protein